jgi:GT2 family glycosyltransferase
LPERPPIIVVDNGSSDGTARAVHRHFPEVRVIALDRNIGPAARTIGVEALDTEVVAFNDDDSWWAPGSLSRAAGVIASHPRIGLLAARVLVGEARRLDPVCESIRESSVAGRDGLPGRPLFGFVACAAVARRSAYLAVGGFHPRIGTGGEEELLTIDLLAAGWDLRYDDDLVALHFPEAGRDNGARRRTQARNALWTAWLRSPPSEAARRTLAVARDAVGDADVRRGFLDAARGAPWVTRERRPVPVALAKEKRRLEVTWQGTL